MATAAVLVVGLGVAGCGGGATASGGDQAGSARSGETRVAAVTAADRGEAASPDGPSSSSTVGECAPGTEAAGPRSCAFPDDVPASPEARNVMGTPLATCGSEPLTGFRRTGRCETGPDDRGVHVVCAEVTEAFLTYSAERGNDLVTPRPAWRFPGLEPGDRWCLCAARWLEAVDGGVAPPVVLEATEETALRTISRDTLARHAVGDAPTR